MPRPLLCETSGMASAQMGIGVRGFTIFIGGEHRLGQGVHLLPGPIPNGWLQECPQNLTLVGKHFSKCPWRMRVCGLFLLVPELSRVLLAIFLMPAEQKPSTQASIPNTSLREADTHKMKLKLFWVTMLNMEGL